MGFDYCDRYLAAVQGLSQADAKDSASKLIPENDFVPVVVSKAVEIKLQLEKFGTWMAKKITDPDF